MNSAGNCTFLNISQNMDNMKKIQLVSHYYNVSLADTLNFIQLKCHLILVKYNHIFWEKSAFTPVLKEMRKKFINLSPQMTNCHLLPKFHFTRTVF